jgi:hypothetical protein
LLESKEVNHLEFCRIKNVLDEIVLMSKNTELSAILNKLLVPASVVTGLKVEADMLVSALSNFWVSYDILDNKCNAALVLQSFVYCLCLIYRFCISINKICIWCAWIIF